MSIGDFLIRLAPHLPWRVNYGVRKVFGITPDFFIAGFPKCGTTSLYSYLIQHPNILPADGKEQWYFSTFPLKPEGWYKFRFPYGVDRTLGDLGLRHRFIVGDGTPDYIFREKSIAAMADMVPDAKIILLLRNPIERSYSYFQHETRAGRITGSFEEFVTRERVEYASRGVMMHEELYEHPQLKDTFLLGSLYSEYVAKLLKYYPENRVLMLCSEDFFSAPKLTFDKVTDFLGLERNESVEFKVHNPGNYDKDNIPHFDDLADFYRPFNRKLEEATGFDAPWIDM